MCGYRSKTSCWARAAGIRAVLTGSSGGILDYHYADTVQQLGHYCELIRLRPAGRDFWSAVPRN